MDGRGINYTLEEAQSQVGPGWAGLVKKIYDKLPDGAFIEQIKEKFGGLRFYVSNVPMEMFDFIGDVEEESYTICEECGKPGTTRDDLGWVLTLCDEHHATRIAQRKERGLSKP